MRSLILFLALLTHFTTSAQVKFNIELQADKVTYLVKLKPEVSYDAPMNLTNTAQVSLLVPTGGFKIGNIQNFKGQWFNNNNVIAPASNPSKDYLIFNLVGHMKDIEYVAGEAVVLFSFENVGKKTGMPKFVSKKSATMLKNKKLNVGNQISILGAGYGNAYKGFYVDEIVEEDGPELEDVHILYGNPTTAAFDLELNVSKNGMELEWVSIRRNDLSKFTIEKSIDGINFEAIKKITSTDNSQFKEVDEAPDYGTNYYRIKEELKDGTALYSNIQQEQYVLDEASITMYPNPVKDNLNLRVGHFANVEGAVRIFNMSGIEMSNNFLDKDNKLLKINTSSLQSGIYFLIIESKERKIVERQFIVENLN